MDYKWMIIITFLTTFRSSTEASIKLLHSCMELSINTELVDCSTLSRTCQGAKIESLNYEDIPYDFHKLNCLSLQNASLKHLDRNVFDDLKELRYLDMHDNSLDSISSRLFQNLNELKYLDLSHNKLTSLDDSILFMSQRKLEVLTLAFNRIEYLDVVVVAPLKSLKELNFSGNPIYCDCDAFWVMNWCQGKRLMVNITCNEPYNFKGLPWTVLENERKCFIKESSIENVYLPKYIERKSVSVSQTLITIVAAITFVLMILSCVSFILFVYFAKKKNDLQTNIRVNYGTKSNSYSENDNVISDDEKGMSFDVERPKQVRETTLYDNVEDPEGNSFRVGKILGVHKKAEVEEPSLSGLSTRRILSSENSEMSVEGNSYIGFRNSLYSEN